MARSEAQKRADKRYAETHKGAQKKFATTFSAEEADHIESVISENGMTKAEFVRRGVARLERGEEL